MNLDLGPVLTRGDGRVRAVVRFKARRFAPELVAQELVAQEQGQRKDANQADDYENIHITAFYLPAVSVTWLPAWRAGSLTGKSNPWRVRARLEEWEVHFGFGHAVEVIGEDIQGDVGDNLHDLRVGEAGFAQRLEVVVTDLAALQDDGLGEAQHRLRLRVGSGRVAGQLHLMMGQTEALAGVVVSGEAVAGAVDFGHCQSHLLALTGSELPAHQRRIRPDVGPQRSRRVGQDLQEPGRFIELQAAALETPLEFRGGAVGLDGSKA